MDAWSAYTDPPTSFTLDGERYDVAGWVDAVVPLAAFEHESWPLPVFGTILKQPSLDRLVERLADPRDGLDLPDLRPVAADLIEATFGRPYWTVGRLLSSGVTQIADLDGALMLSGVDLVDLMRNQPVRAVSVLWAYAMQHAGEEKDRQRLIHNLTTPPVAVMQADDNKAAELEADMFMAAMATQGGR